MKVEVQYTSLDGVLLVTPGLFQDERGFFSEVFNADEYKAAGLPAEFVQVNQSGSVKNTVRGLHFQWSPPMGKLMRVIRGEVFLVAVDMRRDSFTLGKYFGITLSEDDKRMVWAPACFARGFAVLSDWAEIMYMTTGMYNAKAESGVLWNDPAIGIKWPVRNPILSPKDASAQTLAQWMARPEANNFKWEHAA